MSKLASYVSQKTGLTEEMAQDVVDAVLSYFKHELPPASYRRIEEIARQVQNDEPALKHRRQWQIGFKFWQGD